MTASSLHSISRPPLTPPEEGPPPLLFLLHGLRSNEQDLMGLAGALDPRFQIVSIRAPLVFGPSAFAWYPVEFTPGGFLIGEEEAEQSRQKLLRFVLEAVEQHDADASRVFLMGFSQGCAMSLAAALSAPRLFAGVVGMSGRLIDSMADKFASPGELDGLPALIVHGTQDTVIPVEHGRAIRDTLTGLNCDVAYKEYEMAHHVTPESMRTIAAWLKMRLDAAFDWRSMGA